MYIHGKELFLSFFGEDFVSVLIMSSEQCLDKRQEETREEITCVPPGAGVGYSFISLLNHRWLNFNIIGGVNVKCMHACMHSIKIALKTIYHHKKSF